MKGICFMLVKRHESKIMIYDFLISGCNNHMIGDKSIFVEIGDCKNFQVKMGNGVLVQLKGKGTIAIYEKEKESEQTIS